MEKKRKPLLALVRMLTRLQRDAEALAALREFSAAAPPEERAAVAAAMRESARRAQPSNTPARVRLVVTLIAPGAAAPMLGVSSQDGFALARQPMAPSENGRFVATLTLDAHVALPYVLVVEEGGVPLASARVRLDRVSGAQTALTLEAHRSPRVPAPPPLARALEQREHARGGKPGKLVALWLDGGSWFLVRSLEAAGRLIALPALEASGVSAPMFNDDPHTQAALEQFTSTGGPAPSLYAELVSGLGQLRFAVGGVGALGQLDPVRLAALDAPGQRTLRQLLADGHRSYLPLIWGDAAVTSADDQHLYDRAGARVPLDLSPLEQPLEVGAYLADLRAHAPGAGQELYKSSAIALARMHRRLALTRTLLAHHQPDFTLIRVDETDTLAHQLWDGLDEPSPEGAILERMYQLVDDEVAALVESLAPEDNLLVVSDHGMSSQVDHDTTCLFIADGPSFRSGTRTRLSSRQLLSVFLATLGLAPPVPVPVDLFRRSP